MISKNPPKKKNAFKRYSSSISAMIRDGYNYMQKPTPNDFITFYFHNAVDSMPTITFGNNFSKNDEIAQLFKVF